MTDTLISVLGFAFVFTIVVAAHEMGHFWVARWVGVRAEAFSVGFGKPIIQHTDKRGVNWRLGWAPLGGYVAFRETGEGAFGDAGPWRRFAVAVAGPLANFVFAIVVLAGALWIVGESGRAPVARVVMDGSAAAEAGLRPGDRFLFVDGAEVRTFEDVARATALSNGREMAFAIARDGAAIEIAAAPRLQASGRSLLGIQGPNGDNASDLVKVRYGLGESFGAATGRLWAALTGSLTHVWVAATSDDVNSGLAGPVGIARMSGQAALGGFAVLAGFIALLSMSLGVFNLLPLPLLDGGHAAMAVWEGIGGRQPSATLRRVSVTAGVVALVSLMLWVTTSDILALFIPTP